MTAPRRSPRPRQDTLSASERPVTCPQTPGMATESVVPSVARLAFTVPYPPSTNNLYMTVRGRRVKTQEARDYTEVVAQRVWLAQRLGGTVGEPPYLLTVDLYPPSRRPDASNGVKCLEDGLFAAIKRNDRTVQRIVIEKHDPDPRNPRAEVVLEPLDHAEPRQGEGA